MCASSKQIKINMSEFEQYAHELMKEYNVQCISELPCNALDELIKYSHKADSCDNVRRGIEALKRNSPFYVTSRLIYEDY